MVNSMTGFATQTGATDSASWAWEIRSVNGKGFDLRVRLPEGAEGLEKQVKAAVSAACSRGTVTVGLRVKQKANEGLPELSKDALGRVLNAAQSATAAAQEKGLETGPLNVADLLNVRSVLTYSGGDGVQAWVKEAGDQIDALVTSFQQARSDEGSAMDKVLGDQIATMQNLRNEANEAVADRKTNVTENLRAKMAEVLQNADSVDEGRLEQELALLAVKSDVTEELDRLDAHIAAAAELLATKGPIGRKFDFLMQEFNREANTLCSKSGHTELTRIGLDLKTVIDQMREQVQNVE